MQIQLPEHVQFIIEQFYGAGFEAYAVGGCIRDSILGRVPQDWDITTSAKPEEIKALFSHTVDTGIAHGTVTVMLDHIGYEVTTYRIDGEYEDSRHPKEVTFTASLEEDLKRRDFTINAMAYNDRVGLVDLFEGQKDLEEKRIRCVGIAEERFGEDALRMMRAVRFAAQLGYTLDTETAEAIRALAPTLAKISIERIHAELEKLLVSAHPEMIRDLYEMGLTQIFLPEFDVMMETPQNSLHHCYSVGEHTIHAVCGVKADRILRWTMLFHDISKPECKTTDAKGVDHFYRHTVVGAERTKEIMRRLKFDNATTALVTNLVRWHDAAPTSRPEISPEMRHEADPEISEKTVRRLVSRMGEEAFAYIFDIRRADILAQSEYYREKKLDILERFESTYQVVLQKKQCVSIKDLAINGSDLIAIGFTPGPGIGAFLQELLTEVLETPEKNTRDYLIGRAEKYIGNTN